MPKKSPSIRKHSPSFVITAGTQVVLNVRREVDAENPDDVTYRKPGSVGIVAKCPDRADGNYTVEFADGRTVQASFDELSLRREEIDDQLSKTDDELQRYVIYVCKVGSKAYGLAHDESDDDIRGIFLPPARKHWSLYSIPEQLELVDNGRDEVYWEIEKFVRLALKANPNVLETLWTPIILKANHIANQLREIRSAFLSKHLYKTYSGYVLSQFRRMKNRVKRKDDFKTKHAMHLIRLLHSGIHALKTREILIDVGEHRDELMRIRAGKLSFDQIRERAFELDGEFQQVFDHADLPEQPDFQMIDQFLINARKSAIDL